MRQAQALTLALAQDDPFALRDAYAEGLRIAAKRGGTCSTRPPSCCRTRPASRWRG
ncbi:hypothetical protein ACRAWD_06095 [Caulobacter segnis]